MVGIAEQNRALVVGASECLYIRTIARNIYAWNILNLRAEVEDPIASHESRESRQKFPGRINNSSAVVGKPTQPGYSLVFP